MSWFAYCKRLFIITLLITSQASLSAELPVLRLASIKQLRALYPHAHQAISNAGLELGYQIEFVDLPAARASRQANAGDLDGEALRVRTPGKSPSANLLLVDQPLFQSEVWYWTNKNNHCPKPDQLPYRKPVGIIGWQYFEQMYALSRVGHEQVIEPTKIFDMLRRGRADYFPAPLEVVERVFSLQREHLKTCLKRPLSIRSSYMLLHERHQELVPKFAAALSKQLARVAATPPVASSSRSPLLPSPYVP